MQPDATEPSPRRAASSTTEQSLLPQAYNTLRISLIISAVLGIVLGIVILVWPGVTLATLGIFLGFALLVGGIYRIVAAIRGPFTGGMKFALIAIGVLIVIGGIIALISPGDVLIALALVVGISWILSGIFEFAMGVANYTIGPRWWSIVSGIISVLAGITVCLLPGLALTTFVIFGGVMLIVVSIATLLNLPAKASTLN